MMAAKLWNSKTLWIGQRHKDNMNFEFDTEKVVGFIRSGFRIVLWLMIVFSMYFNDWLQVIAAAVILAVLELEEMNQKLDDQ